jgi:hypothetical protein
LFRKNIRHIFSQGSEQINQTFQKKVKICKNDEGCLISMPTMFVLSGDGALLSRQIKYAVTLLAALVAWGSYVSLWEKMNIFVHLILKLILKKSLKINFFI